MVSAGRARELLSVGIDVGTTTTQVVFSDLAVRDTARPGSVPRVAIEARSVRYEGPIHLTPLRSAEEVDTTRLSELVAGEYAAAGVTASAVETGAVIVTGEIARTEHADEILAALSDLAGDFVVTVAGPNLEAQIAARGSGAAAVSAERYAQVTNVDIGGGTANAAVFRAGAHLGSAAAAVGGRQLQLATDGTVAHLAPPGRRLVEHLGLPLSVGARADHAALTRLCEAMAEVIADLVDGTTSPLSDLVALTPPLPHAHGSSTVLLSGGVGASYVAEEPADTLAQVAAYGDVGPLLARALRASARLQARTVAAPSQTLRATVLGAASQTVTLSGSTIWARADLLPLRNLPVVRPDLEGSAPTPEGIAGALSTAAQRWDRAGNGHLALALHLPERLDYEGLQRLAEGLAGYATDLSDGQPLVLVIGRDYAQALGQSIQARDPQRPLVVVDQVGLDEGDFIDLGTPILDGRAIPLSVKTLVFYR